MGAQEKSRECLDTAMVTREWHITVYTRTNGAPDPRLICPTPGIIYRTHPPMSSAIRSRPTELGGTPERVTTTTTTTTTTTSGQWDPRQWVVGSFFLQALLGRPPVYREHHVPRAAASVSLSRGPGRRQMRSEIRDRVQPDLCERKTRYTYTNGLLKDPQSSIFLIHHPTAVRHRHIRSFPRARPLPSLLDVDHIASRQHRLVPRGRVGAGTVDAALYRVCGSLRPARPVGLE